MRDAIPRAPDPPTEPLRRQLPDLSSHIATAYVSRGVCSYGLPLAGQSGGSTSVHRRNPRTETLLVYIGIADGTPMPAQWTRRRRCRDVVMAYPWRVSQEEVRRFTGVPPSDALGTVEELADLFLFFCFFSQHLGACRRRTPRTRVDPKVPEDAPHRDPFFRRYPPTRS